VELTPQVKNQIAQFQNLQQQLQAVGTQKYQLEIQLNELQRTLKELDSIEDDAPIYKSIGSLLVKARDKDSVKAELDEKKETTELRVKSLERQENSLKEKYTALQEQISQAVKGTGG